MNKEVFKTWFRGILKEIPEKEIQDRFAAISSKENPFTLCIPTMKAELLPLPSKYSRTEIKFGDVNIYLTNSNYDFFNPSDRVLETVGVTREEWEKDEEREVDVSWRGGIPWNHETVIMTTKDFCDFEYSHCEHQETYEAALKIVNALNPEGGKE